MTIAAETDLATRRAANALRAFTAFNSFSAGIATLGIFFLTKSAYAFSATENYCLGVLLGVTYIFGAIFAGRGIRVIEKRVPSLHPRAIAGFVVALLAAIIAAPAICGSGAVGRASVWVAICGYSILTGALWPIVESYQSGGLRDAALRRGIASFNVTWSGANAIAMWSIAPLVERHPLAVLVCIAVIHLASVPFLRALPVRPLRHLNDLEPHPPSYVSLLAIHRVLLAAAYVVMYALVPYLPVLCDKLAVEGAWQTPFASTWMVVRIGAFYVLARSHAWHGKGMTAVVGCVLLLAGFGLAVLSPGVGSHPFDLALAIAGLVSFGIGIATLYNAALYYALAVGAAEVDAGGKHEALIGVGYTVGPLCGLAATGLVSAEAVAPENRESAILVLVSLVLAAAVVVAIRAGSAAASRSARSPAANTSSR